MQLKNIKVTWEDIAKCTITLAAAETDNGNVQNMISSECIVSYITHQQILSYVLTLHPITNAVGLHASSHLTFCTTCFQTPDLGQITVSWSCFSWYVLSVCAYLYLALYTKMYTYLSVYRKNTEGPEGMIQ